MVLNVQISQFKEPHRRWSYVPASEGSALWSSYQCSECDSDREQHPPVIFHAESQLNNVSKRKALQSILHSVRKSGTKVRNWNWGQKYVLKLETQEQKGSCWPHPKCKVELVWTIARRGPKRAPTRISGHHLALKAIASKRLRMQPSLPGHPKTSRFLGAQVLPLCRVAEWRRSCRNPCDKAPSDR